MGLNKGYIPVEKLFRLYSCCKARCVLLVFFVPIFRLEKI
jgi:hypothetical protein